MKKFNIAYIPRKEGFRFSKLSKICKNHISYSLFENKSLPHITVCHFFAEEKSIGDLTLQISSLDIDTCLHIEFGKYSKKTFNGSTYWLSLLPDNTNELHNTFGIISKIVKRVRTDEYDPHLTLFNYYESEKITLPVGDISIKDDFDLIIGESDVSGQLLRVIVNLDEIKSSLQLRK